MVTTAATMSSIESDAIVDTNAEDNDSLVRQLRLEYEQQIEQWRKKYHEALAQRRVLEQEHAVEVETLQSQLNEERQEHLKALYQIQEYRQKAKEAENALQERTAHFVEESNEQQLLIEGLREVRWEAVSLWSYRKSG